MKVPQRRNTKINHKSLRKLYMINKLITASGVAPYMGLSNPCENPGAASCALQLNPTEGGTDTWGFLFGVVENLLKTLKPRSSGILKPAVEKL